MLAGAELGEAALYEGRVDTLDLSLGSVVIAGTYRGGAAPVPFRFELAIDDPLLGADATAHLHADAPPAEGVLHVDLVGVLDRMPAEEAPASGTWTLDSTAHQNTFKDAVRRAALWTLEFE